MSSLGGRNSEQAHCPLSALVEAEALVAMSPYALRKVLPEGSQL
jgi:hypothetical protein